MPYYPDDTIVAIASPPGGAARGIVRLSGPDMLPCLTKVLHTASKTLPAAVTASMCIDGAVSLEGMASRLPCEVYLWPDRKSYTGGPVAELHTLGSRPLLEALVRTLCRAGARLAEPGEFTLRAFLAGRIDLTQAEAVLGVIDSQDHSQLDVALAQLAGGLGAPLGRLRDELVELVAHLEAGFDFPDEPIAFITPDQLRRQLTAAAQTVADLAAKIHARGDTAPAVRAVLIGWPNTGKSSLFNALSGCCRALVSREPGTTRDYLTAELDLEGVRSELIDTAGVEADPENAPADIWQAVQDVTHEQIQRAQLHILCIDATRPLNPWEESRLLEAPAPQSIVVLTKIDAADNPIPVAGAIPTSSVTGHGLERLGARLRQAVLDVGVAGDGMVAATATRCQESLRQAADCLQRASQLANTGGPEELVAADLRNALDALGMVVGAVYTEDVLDQIFSRFCIGK